MCKPMKSSLICGCMSALLLALVLLFAVPTFAHAQQATKDIDSTMTVTMQQSSNSVAATSNTTASNNKTSTTSSGKAPSTGDAAPFAILGVIVLCAGGAYCLYKSKKLASAAQGTRMGKSSRGTHVRPKGQNSGSTTKQVLSVAIATILATSFCFGGFVSKASAQDESEDSDVECSADVVIDEEGNVLSADVSLTNNSDNIIGILDIIAPEELSDSDWEALIEYGIWDEEGWHEYDWDEYDWEEYDWNEADWSEAELSSSDLAVASSDANASATSDVIADVKPGATATGTWSGTKVSSDVLAKVKSNGSARLNYRVMIYPDLQGMFSWVTFDANAPSGTTATINGKKDVVVKRMKHGTTITSDIIPEDSAITCSDDDYVFMGWAESKTEDAFSGKTRSELVAANVLVWDTKTYYAMWAKTGDYWLSVAGADNPKAGMLKNQSQIDEDMQVLHGTKTQTSAGKDKAAVTTEYTNYMNGKNANGTADQEVRLYSKWSGSDAGTGANRWVEFRIIQVGEHDGDGSAVTFIATHSLPTVKQMNTANTSRGGWSASTMRNDTFANYVSSGLEGLASAALTVKKTALDGDTNDKLWMISSTEVFGSGDNNYVAHNFPWEGNQYTWFANNGVSMRWGWETKNGVLGSMPKTRAGSNPAGGDGDCWWTRTPSAYEYYTFAKVDHDGSLGNRGGANALGVVPAFCF